MLINWHFVSFVIATIGDVITAIMVLLVHERVRKARGREGARSVAKILKREAMFGWIGVALIVIGSVGQMIF